LFDDLYPWAGSIRVIDIAKQATRFCTVDRIEPEANKLFVELAKNKFFMELDKSVLISAAAEFYADLNVVHPFREGNGRAQRILFEHLIVNCGYEISWEAVNKEAWIIGNINGYHGDYRAMEIIFSHCIGDVIPAE
jgi:cell filamentation protein